MSATPEGVEKAMQHACAKQSELVRDFGGYAAAEEAWNELRAAIAAHVAARVGEERALWDWVKSNVCTITTRNSDGEEVAFETTAEWYATDIIDALMRACPNGDVPVDVALAAVTEGGA